MEMDIISKAFLGIYRYLNVLTKSIDRVVKIKGINSSSFNDYYKNNTEDQTEELLALTNKKITLINIKVIVDKTLLKLKSEQARILTLKYIDNFSSKQICELMSLQPRTYFRKVNAALNEFQKHLLVFFNSNAQVKCDILEQSWVKTLLNNYTKDTKINCEVDGSFIYKTIIKSLKRSVAC